MQSISLPPTISLFISSDYIKIEGPLGVFIKKRGSFKFSLLSTPQGSRLFVIGLSSKDESIMLAQTITQIIGLTLGFRKRLRLRGIGFRGTIQESIVSKKIIISGKRIVFPKHRLREENENGVSNNPQDVLILKLGYSHDTAYPLAVTQNNNIKIAVSRLEGRTKGTVIAIKGSNLSEISSIAQTISAFRSPDMYKGKGIHYDKQMLSLKKGKRQS